MSFSRSIASSIVFGTSPRALHRSTWKASVSRRGCASSTYSSGVFETMPPSQYQRPSISIGGKAGGSAPEAITWRASMRVDVAVEVDEIGARDVDGAERDRHVGRIEQVPVDQRVERARAARLVS